MDFAWFQYVAIGTQTGHVTVGELPPVFVKLKGFSEVFNADEIKTILGESYSNPNEELDFETFLRVSLCMAFILFPNWDYFVVKSKHC